jgi:hypothetical protein
MSNITPCGLDGNIGFPYAFTGEMINVMLSEINMPIRFSFGDMKITPTLMRETSSININSSSSNTILYNGTKYELGYTQLCQPHSLWSLKNSSIIAEIIFTFITKDKSTTNPLIVTLSYLIEKTAKGDDKNEFLNSMFSNIPPTKNINIIDLCSTSPSHFLYFSCIPYLEKEKNIGGLRAMCIIGERSIKVNSELLKQLNLRKYRLPSSLLLTNNRQTIISYSIKAAGMSNPIVSNIGETFHNSIDTNNDTFKNRFKIFNFVKKVSISRPKMRIEGFVDVSTPSHQEGGNIDAETESENKKSTDYIALDELKCYPISQKTDINGDILLIDPSTGKRMDNYLLDANTALKGPGEIEVPGKKRKFAIVLGIIAGILITVLIISLILSFTFKKSTQTIIETATKTVVPMAKDATKEMFIPVAATTMLLSTTK